MQIVEHSDSDNDDFNLDFGSPQINNALKDILKARRYLSKLKSVNSKSHGASHLDNQDSQIHKINPGD